MTWGGVRRENLRLLSGAPRKIPHANRIRHFAGCCGTHLFFEASPDAEWVDVTIGSLDDPALYPPEISIWTEDRLPWVAIDERRPAYSRSSAPKA